MASQLSIGFPIHLPKSAYQYGERSSGEVHGVVLTKEHIVNMILDIAGYRASEDLSSTTFLEPSCGHGAFIVPAIHRLFKSLGGKALDVRRLEDRFLAYDIDEEHVKITRDAVQRALVENGITKATACFLAESWIRCGDFLLECENRNFDFVVGNPPYIRIEQLSPKLQAEYRSRFSSLFDRADIYVAFIESGLDKLSSNGNLTFICADRWILNKYGAPLREKVTKDFGIRHYIDLHEASPFESEVIAYPAVFTIAKQKCETVQVATLHTATPDECRTVTARLLQGKSKSNGVDVHKYTTWFTGAEPWVLGSPEHLRVLRELENRFSPLESHGDTRVGIGVATGNDKVYIVDSTTDVEPDRLVPLVKREDIVDGKILDAGRSVVNTFTQGNGTVNLDEYPRLKAFFEKHEALVKKRHVAKKNPGSWFRTIDRVYPRACNETEAAHPRYRRLQ